MQPLKKVITGHLEHPINDFGVGFASIVIDDSVLYSGSLAKCRAAFLRPFIGCRVLLRSGAFGHET